MLKFALWGVLSATIACVAGCATAPDGGFCTEARPLIPADPGVVDWLIDHDLQLADDMLAHNEHGEKLCGWTPPNAS
ncbi:MAG: hypothetical protein AAGI34_15190 [Pseudomonadota bacterium]